MSNQPSSGAVQLSSAIQGGFVGPNAIIQVAHAVNESLGPRCLRRMLKHAHVTNPLLAPPEGMIDQGSALALMRTVRSELPAEQAHLIAYDAGRRTADYLLENRIPRFAKAILAGSPERLATWLLLKAIQRNAWTFAGSGTCTIQGPPTSRISIENNPLAMPGCVWHVAVFDRLFQRLVNPDIGFAHTSCCCAGAKSCVFELRHGLSSGSASA